jgi:hypothetical protein
MLQILLRIIRGNAVVPLPVPEHGTDSSKQIDWGLLKKQFAKKVPTIATIAAPQD